MYQIIKLRKSQLTWRWKKLRAESFDCQPPGLEFCVALSPELDRSFSRLRLQNDSKSEIYNTK